MQAHRTRRAGLGSPTVVLVLAVGGRHTIWVDRVPQANTVKHRVHLDIYARDLGDLEALGSAIAEPRHGTRTWTVMADPEGGRVRRVPASRGPG